MTDVAAAPPVITDTDWLNMHNCIMVGDKKGIKDLFNKYSAEGFICVHAPSGWTALQIAVRYAGTDIVGWFLSENADVHARHQHSGVSPIVETGEAGASAAVAALLLARGASVHDRADDGKTALIYAASHTACLDLVQLLVANGADINAQDKDGMTALHRAVWCRQHAIAAWLLENGADAGLAKKNGGTALSIARELNFLEAVDLIEQHEEKLEVAATKHLTEMRHAQLKPHHAPKPAFKRGAR